jgi:hypothetical protein
MSEHVKHGYEFGLFRLNAAERLLLRDGESPSTKWVWATMVMI